MSIFNLDKVFCPETVAVIGATEREGSIGHAVMANLVGSGYMGDIYPINPHHDTVWGMSSRSSILDFSVPPDLAVIITPIASVPNIVKECTQAGVGGAVIISAGGKETGPEGREIEALIKKEAAKTGMRIIGPNCLGIISVKHKLNASFAGHMPLSGKMAFISQSGAICTAILDLSLNEQIGFSHFVSLGSMVDVDFGDMIDYLGNDPNVSSIVMYVENLTNIRNFMSAARSVARIKPIIALKAGRSRVGIRAATSHTGAMTGEDAVYDAAFKRAGIVRVRTFEELFDCAELLSKHTRLAGSHLAIITNAGGPGVMAADALSDYGVEPVELLPETVSKLNAILPEYWSKANPIDILGDASPELYEQVADICLAASEVDALLIMLTPQALTDPAGVARRLSSKIMDKKIPVFTAWIGGNDVKDGCKIFNQTGIPTFDSPERAVRAFMDLYRHSKNVELVNEIPSKLPKKLNFEKSEVAQKVMKSLDQQQYHLTEMESKKLLSDYGIPVNPTELATSVEDAVGIAQSMGFPVVLKICSRTVHHKTDVGGIALDLKDEADVRQAYDRIISNVRHFMPEADVLGVSVQPMISPMFRGQELILGAKLDPDFGPVILFGMGGIMTEVLKDKAIALPPLNRLLAARLLEETKVYQMLIGHRNQPPADLTMLEEMLVRLSQLMSDFSQIKELDINPFVIEQSKAYALDARIVLQPNAVAAPMHMVISPYPNEYETQKLCKAGEPIFIRPVRPEDAPLLVENFKSLSKRSIYRRFFSPLKELSPEMIARFTQIDYDREIALVAIADTTGEERLVGVARIINSPDARKAEFSVLVTDAWQGRGVGKGLLSRCLTIARQRGLEIVEGYVLAENTQMLSLCEKLGFSKSNVLGLGEYRMTIDLIKHDQAAA